MKTDKEKFAGAEATYTIEALMHDGKALQSGTSHYCGDGFAKAFDVTFTDKDNQIKTVFETSFGVTTRIIGAVIMVHGDDSGLKLPPHIAPVQVNIIPVAAHKEGVLEAANNLKNRLIAAGVRVKLDDSEKSPGFKFAESEMRSIRSRQAGRVVTTLMPPPPLQRLGRGLLAGWRCRFQALPHHSIAPCRF